MGPTRLQILCAGASILWLIGLFLMATFYPPQVDIRVSVPIVRRDEVNRPDNMSINMMSSTDSNESINEARHLLKHVQDPVDQAKSSLRQSTPTATAIQEHFSKSSPIGLMENPVINDELDDFELSDPIQKPTTKRVLRRKVDGMRGMVNDMNGKSDSQQRMTQKECEQELSKIHSIDEWKVLKKYFKNGQEWKENGCTHDTDAFHKELIHNKRSTNNNHNIDDNIDIELDKDYDWPSISNGGKLKWKQCRRGDWTYYGAPLKDGYVPNRDNINNASKIAKESQTGGKNNYDNGKSLKITVQLDDISSEIALVQCGDDQHEIGVGNVMNELLLKQLLITSNKRQLNLIILTVHSLSRFTYFKQFPLTAAFLAKASRSHAYDGTLFDYPLHNIVGEDDFENNVALFLGDARLYSSDNGIHASKHLKHTLFGDDLRYFTNHVQFQNAKYRRNHLLWNRFKQQGGYVTALIDEQCSMRHVPFSYQIDKDFDHSSRNIYCLAQTMQPYDHHKIGSRYSHDLSLDYATNFALNYANTSRLSIINLRLSDDLNQLQSFDRRLRQYLYHMIHQHNSLIVLRSDHGPRYRHDRHTRRGVLHYRLPLLQIWAPSSVLTDQDMNRIEHNTHRIVTSWDVQKTLTDLLSQTHVNDDDDDELFTVNASSSYVKSTWSRNLFFDTLESTRTCVDARVIDERCACSHWKDMSASSLYVKQLPGPLECIFRQVLGVYNGPIAKVGGQHCLLASRHESKLERIAFNELSSNSNGDNNWNIQILFVWSRMNATIEAMVNVEVNERLSHVVRHKAIRSVQMNDNGHPTIVFRSRINAQSNPRDKVVETKLTVQYFRRTTQYQSQLDSMCKREAKLAGLPIPLCMCSSELISSPQRNEWPVV